MHTFPLSIKFGTNGDYRSVAAEGWHHDDTEVAYTWTSCMAQIVLSIARTRRSVVMHLDAISNGEEQDVFVYVNGLFGAFWKVGATASVSANLQGNIFRSGENVLSIVCPMARLPTDTLSRDRRILGIAVRSLSLTERVSEAAAERH